MELVYADKSCIKFVDISSEHTILFTALYLLLFVVVLFHVSFTTLGWITWLFMPVLHRFVLRYFWTKFEVYEGEHAPIRAEILLKRKESRKTLKTLKKAAVAIEAVLILAVVIAAFKITEYPPFMIDSFESVKIEQDLETAEELYLYSYEYLQEQFPGTNLIAYRLGFEEEGWTQEDGTKVDYTWCYMFFRNPRQGLFFRNLKELMFIQICSEYDYMLIDFFTAEGIYASAQTIEFVPIPGDYPEWFYK